VRRPIPDDNGRTCEIAQSIVSDRELLIEQTLYFRIRLDLPTQHIGYDKLDHLTSANSSALGLTWTYDGDGNRMTQVGAAPAYNGSSTLGYDSRGRLSSLTNASGTTSYKYNALGQRIAKIGPLGTTIYSYDEAGHLVGEYNGSGILIQETIWLGDIPVATIRPHSGGGIDVYYIHADHLNSPKIITRPSDNAIVWRWNSDPFGTAAANQNPSGLGAFAYNLRFPGQYYDAETGLSQNYLRDCYDPQTGRYCQSDPIGLMGGSFSPYAYAGGNPISYADPNGQCPWCVVAAGAAVGGSAAFVGTLWGGGSLGDAVAAIPGGALGGAAAVALAGVEAVTAVGTALGVVADIGINLGMHAIDVATVIAPSSPSSTPNSNASGASCK
jgi:RHS repeat-associated protein